MERTITVSEQVYTALQRQATRSRKQLDALAESWLKQRLDLGRYLELKWRYGPGGWRVGIGDTAIDVYTVVGYSQIGYSPQEIAGELLPRLSLGQVRVALDYYAEYPDEIDQALSENEDRFSKARLYRSLGPVAYRHLTGAAGDPHVIQEARARYPEGDESLDGSG